MHIKQHHIEQAAGVTGINTTDLAAFLAEGSNHNYGPNEWLFQESTPRLWTGIILEGEVEIVRGLHGRTQHIMTLSKGALLSEGLLLEDDVHINGAYTRHGATVQQIPREKLAACQKTHPDRYYRIVSRVAVGINRRMRLLSDQLYTSRQETHQINGFRTEYDSLGQREIPNQAYYGVQTLRAMENFAISGVFIHNFEHMIEGMAMVKMAAAQANYELDRLDATRMATICTVCDELLKGQLHDQFTVDMFQGGAGTSSNMNANEVIANRGLELLGHQKGDYVHLHPNDHVNCSQSTNDVYPTAIKLAVLLSIRSLVPAMHELERALKRKAEEFKDVLKMGRTENQDAVPMTLGQEFSAYAVMIGSSIRAVEHGADELLDINMGATAIGTGINSPPGYADLVTKKLAKISGFPLRRAHNLVEATQNAGSFVQMSASLKRAAVQISKVCNDLRWLSSGPRCGLNEINLPPMQPGSTIMPGKVNPVIPELVNQVCYQVMGYDTVVSMAAEASELELCMAEPIIAYDLLHGIMILKNACITLAARCINGLTANREQCLMYVEDSIGLITAIVPIIGYDQSADIAMEALQTGASVYCLILDKGLLSKEQLDDLLRPENMTDPREIPRYQA
ncbi:aspartate ammonia-lyase [Desulfobulbus oligotrophicus]|jgi:aspartate ammonia-lyase|uniref:Aspartate ammonia-lyase n=1 Tax=Desulfobulbus oligotrophicus TaxID=1909699 RepID=A0A7T5VFA3_9BACT|nr:aspartate ammonia-lyase [Desulfobulbus oligotrophicus]MDY0389969.1 aspartate ammonia-lyase [Desulfobulbus oligotrophicus]QQG66776.1 aspartate ammonia-lyase [Desulfobulbus oligotrophicus]